MNRTKAREYAFILLFEYRFQPDEIGSLIDSFAEEYEPGEQLEYVRDVVLGAIDDLENTDAAIDDAAAGRTFDRMSNVCIAVLRLAVYEILHRDDIPNMVSLNEAVALAKRYDGEEAAPFVNAVLDSIIKNRAAER